MSDLAKRLDCAVSDSDTTTQKRRKIIAKLDASIKLDGRSDAECSEFFARRTAACARRQAAAAARAGGTVKIDARTGPAMIRRKSHERDARPLQQCAGKGAK